MISGAMDELGYSIRNAQESVEELKQKLLYTSMELEAARIAADEETKKHTEGTRYLLCLLKTACKERDEARDQLQQLLHKLPMSVTHTHDSSSLSPVFDPPSHITPGKTSSGLTESLASSFLDPVSSPELSNANNASVVSSGGVASKGVDVGSRIVDDLARGRSLPQKGRLLEAVTESGPLLQTLLVAGPLPRWRNPPPPQPIRIPSMVTAAGKNPQMWSATFSNSSQPWLVPSVAKTPQRSAMY